MENTKNISKEYYRNHLLCFHQQENICIGEVFETPPIEGTISTDSADALKRSEERIAYCESLDKDSARQYCRQIVDTQIARQNASRQGYCINETSLGNALQSIYAHISFALKQLLEAHFTHDNQALGIEQLQDIGNFNATTEVYLAYAELARLLCDAMGHIPASVHYNQDPYLSMIIDVIEPDVQTSDSLSIRLKQPFYNAVCKIFPVNV